MSRPVRPAARSHRIALATHRAAPEATDDDHRLIASLSRQCAVRVEVVPWDAVTINWERYDAVVIRSTWDYHLHRARFVAWAERLGARGVAVWNPAAVVRWNTDKRYLRDLERGGVPVVPTEWIRRGSGVDLASVLRRRGWSRAVVKPSVAATAFRTWTVGTADSASTRHEAALSVVLADADALVQPFLEAVVREGEWSFVYFAASTGSLAFSHAVLKRPARGDFRVQEEFGGSAIAAIPAAALRRQADEAAAALDRIAPGPLLYARVDGVVSDGSHAPPGTFLLMEAELIEPVLFLGSAEHAADRFATAVTQTLCTITRETR